MLTVEQLNGFGPGPWSAASKAYLKLAAGLRKHATALHAEAAKLPWKDETAKLVKQNIDRQGNHATTAADKCEKASVVLTEATAWMLGQQATLRRLLSYCAAEHLVVSQAGVVVPDPAYLAGHPLEGTALAARAVQTTGLIIGVLVEATRTDGRVANQLAAMADLSLPYVDHGPIDMSNDDIRRQADNHHQGPLGHCAFLSPLMSIGRSDPEFIKRHCVWDEKKQQYKVTMYDKDTGKPIDVWVDPRKLDARTGKASGSQHPDYITIYQQAALQTYPELANYNFTLTQKIVMGHATPETDSQQTSFSDIRQAMSSKPPAAVMVATPGAKKPADPSCPVHGGHAYSVKGFDAEGKIILMNPWGHGLRDNKTGIYYPQEVHLTEQQYRDYLHGVTVVKPPF